MRGSVICLLVCLLLSGCSAIRTVYNQAELVAAWRADDYFDLTDEQKRAFRSAFGPLHDWHRATQLKEYASFLEAVNRRLGNNPGQQDVAWAYDRVQEHLRTLVLQSYRDAATLLSTLSDAQVAAAARRFERDNRKFARRHGIGLPPPEQRRLRVEEDLEDIEDWAGALQPAQRTTVSALSEALPLNAAPRLQDRMRRQGEFLQLLKQRHEPAFAARLRDWLLDWNANRPIALDGQLDDFRQARARMWLQVFDALSPEQQRTVAERLRFYSDALHDLSGKAARRADAGPLPHPASR